MRDEADAMALMAEIKYVPEKRSAEFYATKYIWANPDKRLVEATRKMGGALGNHRIESPGGDDPHIKEEPGLTVSPEVTGPETPDREEPRR
jgi:hypothetical protein